MRSFSPTWLVRLVGIAGLLWLLTGGLPVVTAAPDRGDLFPAAVVNLLPTQLPRLTAETSPTPQLPEADKTLPPPADPAASEASRRIMLRKWFGALLLVASVYAGFRWVIQRPPRRF